MDRVKLLRLKKDLFCDMLASTQRMSNMIGSDQFEELGKEVEKRQAIIDQINQADKFLERFSDSVTSSDASQTLVSDIQMLLRDIYVLDQSNNEAAAVKQKEFTSQIKNIKQSKKGINGYAAPFTMQGSVFIDAKK